jgi:hypothetical protein
LKRDLHDGGRHLYLRRPRGQAAPAENSAGPSSIGARSLWPVRRSQRKKNDPAGRQSGGVCSQSREGDKELSSDG